MLHQVDGQAVPIGFQRSNLGEQARRLARIMGGQGSANVFGEADSFSLTAAAFANAFIINALDHDDGVENDGKGMGHPGATLMATAIAALDANPKQVTESALLAGLVAGFEVNNRLIHSLRPVQIVSIKRTASQNTKPSVPLWCMAESAVSMRN
ncbi:MULTISPECIES: MmgE/PrpD family protein [Pseudomonas]|uniref:MmgE/PrpD family protein n=1 Tax=Pseudomonas TaxID=286 RepID=UPI0019159FD9|nr:MULTISPECIES: MmgE/PrpD family protein [Pseudomonas]